MLLHVINFIITAIFAGFGVWTLVWMVMKKREWKFLYRAGEIDRVASGIVISAGFLYLIDFIFRSVVLENGLRLNPELSRRMFGEYWLYFWVFPFTCFFLPQLLWIEKLRTSVLFRVLLAAWTLLIVSAERLVILFTMLHRDYVSEEHPLGTFLLSFFIQIFLFGCLLFIILMLRPRPRTAENHSLDT